VANAGLWFFSAVGMAVYWSKKQRVKSQPASKATASYYPGDSSVGYAQPGACDETAYA